MKNVWIPTLAIVTTSAPTSRFLAEVSFIFLKQILRGGAYDFYHNLNKVNSDWSELNLVFANRYESSTKQDDISSQLIHLSINHLRKPTDHEDQPGLEMHMNRINRHISLARPGDGEEDAKVRFLKEAITETDWVSEKSPTYTTAMDRKRYLTRSVHLCAI